MGKLGDIAAILGLGVVGGVLFMFATGKWKLPSLKDIPDVLIPKDVAIPTPEVTIPATPITPSVTIPSVGVPVQPFVFGTIPQQIEAVLESVIAGVTGALGTGKIETRPQVQPISYEAPEAQRLIEVYQEYAESRLPTIIEERMRGYLTAEERALLR